MKNLVNQIYFNPVYYNDLMIDRNTKYYSIWKHWDGLRYLFHARGLILKVNDSF